MGLEQKICACAGHYKIGPRGESQKRLLVLIPEKDQLVPELKTKILENEGSVLSSGHIVEIELGHRGRRRKSLERRALKQC